MGDRWFAYMVRCSDGSLYAGATNDLAERVRAHNSGKGARYTRTARPVWLVWSKAFPDKSGAMREEARVKSLTKAEKESMLPWKSSVDVLRRRNEMLRMHASVCPPAPEGLEDADAMAALISVCSSNTLGIRDYLVQRYAWGTPTEAILRQIQAPGPVVEMGAGSGYWAWLLRTLGADVVAYDRLARRGNSLNMSNIEGITWSEVLPGDETVLAEHSDRTLLLCWPPRGPMAFSCLDNWRGDVLAYVGDPEVTADDAFHTRLRSEFRLTARIRAPSWPGVMDSLTMWARVRVP